MKVRGSVQSGATQRFSGLAFLFLGATFVIPIAVHGTSTYAIHPAENEDGKDDLPEKGNDVCQSLPERYEGFMDQQVTSDWLRPCEDDYGNESGNGSVGENSLNITVYSSLPAYAPDLAWIVTFAVVGFLNDTSWEYELKSLTGSFHNITEQSEIRQDVNAVLIHNKTYPYRIFRQAASWWWQYDLVFNCFWGRLNKDSFNRNNEPFFTPIKDDFTRLKIQTDLKKYLATGIEALSAFNFEEVTHGLFAISQEDPRTSDDPFKDHPITDPPTQAPLPLGSAQIPSNSPMRDVDGYPPMNNETNVDEILDGATYTVNVNPRLWDWRRYLGMAMFVGTILFTVLVTRLAEYRRRRRTRKELWGNLGTEEGVDALLETTWKFRGDKIRVYNKSGWGYSDDDSMLIGGFQQTFSCADSTTQPDSGEYSPAAPSPPGST